MTKFTLYKDTIQKVFQKSTYKLFIVVYSLYLMFSGQVFALQVEAPLGGQSFKQIKVEATQKKLTDDRVEKIRAYYARYDLPLQHEARHFVEAADKYDIDWRLVAAIGFMESTGGKFACKTVTYNAFGWGSCKYGFDSYEDAIYTISMNLAGEYHKTAHHYKGKDVRGIIDAYNPPSIAPRYAVNVLDQMEIIASQ